MILQVAQVVGDFLPIELPDLRTSPYPHPAENVWVNDFLERKSQRLARWRFQLLFIFTPTPST